ncbi:MAG: response regulator [Treponema sp.]|nr:response regulator [Treponema sp.]
MNIQLLKRRTVELILLDYEMPVLSGLEVFQIMRSEPSTAHIPIIFLTSKDDKKTVMEVLQAGPEAYLLKTKPPAILVQNIKDFFAEKEKKNANNADENAALEGDGEEKAEYKSDLPSSDLPKSDIPASDIPQSDLPKDE